MLRPHTERIRSRTLIYQRLRGKRSHTRRLRGEDAHTKQNAHIPKATRQTLTYQTATRRRRSYEAERSHTEGYEAENLLIYQRLRSEDAHIPDGYEAKTLIRSRTLTYRRLRGRTCSYTKGYEAKTLTYQTATRRRRSYKAERSHTEGYEAENLLIYQRLRSEDARIPQQLQGNPPSYNPKSLRTLRPKNHKMSDRREEQEKASRIILQGSENYTLWRSYILGELKQKNCAWAVTGKPEPTKESVRSDIIAMGFKPTEMTAQALWTALSTEIKEHRASLSKAEGIIKNSVASKH